jgi:hypothetical protein
MVSSDGREPTLIPTGRFFDALAERIPYSVASASRREGPLIGDLGPVVEFALETMLESALMRAVRGGSVQAVELTKEHVVWSSTRQPRWGMPRKKPFRSSLLCEIERAVIVTVTAMRMMQVTVHEIVDVTIVRHAFVTAGCTVDMSLLVSTAGMIRRAPGLVRAVRAD